MVIIHQQAWLLLTQACACSQKMQAQIMHSLVYLQDLIRTLAGVFSCYFIPSCIWTLTVADAGCWMIAISNWLLASFLLLQYIH